MIKVAIIGLGIMGRRMLQHMRIHEKFEPNYLWDPDKSACQKAIEIDSEAKIMNSPEEAIDAADLVYLACPPKVRESYAIETAQKGKALFLEKPLGIDIVNHKDRDKRIKFKKANILNLSLRKSQKFDLIMIKQTIHLIKLSKVKKLLKSLKKILNTENNESPTFKLMKLELNRSLIRDKKIFKIITDLYPQRIKKKFIFNVRISKKKYLDMIKNRYISTLIPLSKKQLIQGIQEIELNYKNKLKFKDKLTCIIL